MSYRHRNTFDHAADAQKRMFRDLRERVERRQQRFEEMIVRRADSGRRPPQQPAVRRRGR